MAAGPDPSPTQARRSKSSRSVPRWIVELVRPVVVSIGLGVVFAFLGVYGTGEIAFGLRVLYWSSMMLLGIASAAIIMPWVFERVLIDKHPALQIAVAAALIALPVTAGLLLIDAADGRMAAPRDWPVQYLYALAISAIMTIGGWGITRLSELRASQAGGSSLAPTAPPVSSSPEQGPAPGPALSERLPVRLRTADIYAVSAEDHYLRVHTSGGEELILLRLSDAIRELAGVEGLQVHRSWWVARQGVAETLRDGGKLVLKLASGVEVPVSRTYANAVRAAGWA